MPTDHEFRVDRLEQLVTQPRTDQKQTGIHLAEIWEGKLWDLTSESFEEFVTEEFEMTLFDAFLAMKTAADESAFPQALADLINSEFEKL
jgi:hypothetical protein